MKKVGRFSNRFSRQPAARAGYLVSALGTIEQPLFTIGLLVRVAGPVFKGIFQAGFTSCSGDGDHGIKWEERRQDIDGKGIDVIWITGEESRGKRGHLSRFREDGGDQVGSWVFIDELRARNTEGDT
jgi:hypothetical protein